MNPQQNGSAIRTLLATLFGMAIGSAVTKGWITADQAAEITAAAVSLVFAVGSAVIGYFGVKAHSPTAVVAAVNSPSVPGVKVVSEASPSPPVMVTPSGAVKAAPDTGKT